MRNQTSEVSGIFVLFGDLQITSFLVPFGNVSLFYGDVWWLIVGIICMTFYVITFITDVVNGVRSDIVLLLVGVAITSGK